MKFSCCVLMLLPSQSTIVLTVLIFDHHCLCIHKSWTQWNKAFLLNSAVCCGYTAGCISFLLLAARIVWLFHFGVVIFSVVAKPYLCSLLGAWGFFFLYLWIIMLLWAYCIVEVFKWKCCKIIEVYEVTVIYYKVSAFQISLRQGLLADIGTHVLKQKGNWRKLLSTTV